MLVCGTEISSISFIQEVPCHRRLHTQVELGVKFLSTNTYYKGLHGVHLGLLKTDLFSVVFNKIV